MLQMRPARNGHACPRAGRQTNTGQTREAPPRRAGHTGNRGHVAERWEVMARGLSDDMATIADAESRLRSGLARGWGRPRQPRAISLPVRVPEPLEFSALLCHNVPSPNPWTQSSTGQATTQGNGHRGSGYSPKLTLCGRFKPAVTAHARLYPARPLCPAEKLFKSIRRLPRGAWPAPCCGTFSWGPARQRAPRCPLPHRYLSGHPCDTGVVAR